MERHSEFKYKIGQLSEENSWIIISDQGDSGWEKEVFDPWSDDSNQGPVEFLMRIIDDKKWHLKEGKPFGYQFVEDEFQMIFIWDDLFGFTVKINDWDQLPQIISFLNSYLE